LRALLSCWRQTGGFDKGLFGKGNLPQLAVNCGHQLPRGEIVLIDLREFERNFSCAFGVVAIEGCQCFVE